MINHLSRQKTLSEWNIPTATRYSDIML